MRPYCSPCDSNFVCSLAARSAGFAARVAFRFAAAVATVTIALSAAVIPSASAQDPPNGWEQRRDERLRPVTDAQKMSIVEAVPERAAVKPDRPRRVLVFFRCEGFIHTSIPHGNEATEVMGRKTGAFRVDLADDYEVFTPENLARYDAVILNNTTRMKFPEPAMEQALLDFVAGGKGLVGYHAASDNFYAHPKLAAVIGGQFNGHPWNAGGTWAFRLDDPDHRLNEAFGGQGFWHQDEIYQYRPDTFAGPEVLRLLVSLDMSKPEVTAPLERDSRGDDYGDGPRDVPVSWLREFGEGRVFVTNLGHREETFWSPDVLRHMLDGIQFALGDLEVDTTPTAKAETESPALAPEKG